MLKTGKVIAVLDDEPEFRKAMNRLLTVRGFRVIEFERGEDLLSTVESDLPNCLLLDLHLPGLNGYGVLEALRFRQIRLPAIVISAHDEPGTSEHVCALGAFAFLKKPVDRDTLLDCMSEAMAGTRKH
jgi:FixJ family two-component response regulator